MLTRPPVEEEVSSGVVSMTRLKHESRVSGLLGCTTTRTFLTRADSARRRNFLDIMIQTFVSMG